MLARGLAGTSILIQTVVVAPAAQNGPYATSLGIEIRNLTRSARTEGYRCLRPAERLLELAEPLAARLAVEPAAACDPGFERIGGAANLASHFATLRWTAARVSSAAAAH